MTNAVLRGKPDAGNPHVRFDEGDVASAKPRRGALLYKMSIEWKGWMAALLAFAAAAAFAVSGKEMRRLPAPEFADLSAARPEWLYGRDWNLMRMTARGVDVQNERFFVDIQFKGFVMTLR